jgi:hypothetical protein
MAKSTKKSDAAPKAAAKPRKPAAKKTAVLATVTPISVSHETVAELAHRLWKERGGVHGHDADDWFRAEQELRGRAS